MIVLDQLRDLPRFVLWRYEHRGAPKPTKVPYQPRRPAAKADVSQPSTWGSFAEASAVLDQVDGLGIVLGQGLVGVDLDSVRDAATGAITAEAQRIVATIDSYTELSPSKAGVHVLAFGELPPGGRRRGCVEMYSEKRFFTLTFDHVSGTPPVIRDRAPVLALVHRTIFGRVPTPPPPTGGPMRRPLIADDAVLIARARAARNGGRFSALWAGDASGYPSQSEADLALCSMLAFWTNGDAARVDRLFLQSGLYRPKWHDARGTKTYGERTLTAALAGRR